MTHQIKKKLQKKIVSNNEQNISIFNEEKLSNDKKDGKLLILGQPLILNQEVFNDNQTSQVKKSI